MNPPQWWLFVLAFLLGLALTFALMIRRVTREVPVTSSETSTTSIPVPDEPATTRIPTALETPTKEISAADVETTTSRSKRRRWWLISGVVVVAVVAVAGAMLGVSSQHQPAPAAAPASSAPTPATSQVTNSSLSGLLLPAQQVADIVGANKIGKNTTTTTLLPDTSRLISEKECIGAWTPAQQGVYRNTGSIGAQVEIIAADEKPVRHIAYQSVIAYPSADGAQQVVVSQSPQWSACSRRTVTANNPANQQPRLFTFGPMTNTDGILSMTETSVDNAIWGCQRALTARSNVVIDIRVCRPNVANQGVDVLSGIAAKIPR